MRRDWRSLLLAFILAWLTLATSNAQFSPEHRNYPTPVDTATKQFRSLYAPVAAAGSPNIVIIMLDDAGFSASSTFGGLAETPTFDRLAAGGLRFTNFHTTALCAPSRAALLTGRNHHSVHMGHFTETAFDAPGYDGYMPFEKATMAEVLRENGYNTFAVGKWHLTPVAERTPAGPFNRWPTGRGFERFYGFHESATDQYYPVLWEGNSRVTLDTSLHRHLNAYLIDQSIRYIRDQKSARPEKPFLLYLTPGAVHSPMQVDDEWIAKYKGKFDIGWDRYREAVLVNQKKLNIAPAATTLHSRHEAIRAWEDLSAGEKKLMARSMEAHAGFLSQTDHEIGRLIHFLEEINQLDNTLVFLIIGDNGATKYTQDLPGLAPEDQKLTGEKRVQAALKNLDKIGRRNFNGDIPLGWTQAMNTPFRLWKTDANSEGGTRNPMIIHFPKAIADRGTIRTQFTHLVDVWPTIIELTGIRIPASVQGYSQAPLEGTSLAYTLESPKVVEKPRVQYFEAGGNRALYASGWKASAYHKNGTGFEADRWELYDMKNDFNERNNLAEKYPEKLKELRLLFEIEAEKHAIYPLRESWFPATKSLQISDSRDKN